MDNIVHGAMSSCRKIACNSESVNVFNDLYGIFIWYFSFDDNLSGNNILSLRFKMLNDDGQWEDPCNAYDIKEGDYRAVISLFDDDGDCVVKLECQHIVWLVRFVSVENRNLSDLRQILWEIIIIQWILW